MLLTLIILYSVLYVVVTVTLTAILSLWLFGDDSKATPKTLYEDIQ